MSWRDTGRMDMQPDEIADLTPELRAILNGWDPIGVADLDPSEYDGLNGSILGCLSRCGDLETFSGSFATLARDFCRDPDEVEAMAVRLHAWFDTKHHAGDQGQHPRPQLRKGRRWRSSHWKR